MKTSAISGIRDEAVMAEEEHVARRTGVPGTTSNKDLLYFERSAPALEKRLLVCMNEDGLLNACSSKMREPPTMGLIPQSSVLGRLESFLPKLDRANRKLFLDIQAQGAEGFDIELVNEAEERYVEMDLVLGVADLRTPDAVAAAELAANGQVIKLDRSEDSSTSSDDSDSEDDRGSVGNEVVGLLDLMSSRGTNRHISRDDHQECRRDGFQVKRKKIELL